MMDSATNASRVAMGDDPRNSATPATYADDPSDP
jgi:hypothetical protein